MFRAKPGHVGKEMYIYTELPDGRVETDKYEEGVITSTVHDRGAAIPASGYFTDEDLQNLADELQRMNVRPREAGKTEGLYEAQSAHLADLRTLLKLDTFITTDMPMGPIEPGSIRRL